MTNPILTPAEIDTAVAKLNCWSLIEDRDAIQRRFRFASFAEAMAFMTAAVPVIEALDHHPEWLNVYNRVDVVLTTHNNGAGKAGLTRLDFELAAALDGLAASSAAPSG